MEIISIDPSHPQFTEWAQVFVTVGQRQWGRDTTAYPPAEIAEMWKGKTHKSAGFAALDADGHVIGGALMGMAQLDNLHLAGFELAALDEHDDDVRRALLARVEETCHENGRTVLLIETQTPVGAADDEGDFLRLAGFEVAQTCVRNAQAVPVSPQIAAHMREAIDLDDGYRIETCVGMLPEEWLEERARLGGMMSTDTPLGDLEIQPEVWTPERVREMFDLDERRGRTAIEAVAWHEATGQMVAYTHVSIPKETPWVAYQDDTLVEKAHRGHHLGYRVKAAVSLLLPQVADGVEVQRTWNDETNIHMLRTNTELGYEREGTMREWQKRLS